MTNTPIPSLLSSESRGIEVISCAWLSVTPWTVAYKATLSIGFSRQAYWNGLPFPSPGDLPHPGIEPRSPALQAGRHFTIWATREALEVKRERMINRSKSIKTCLIHFIISIHRNPILFLYLTRKGSEETREEQDWDHPRVCCRREQHSHKEISFG